MRYLKTIFGRLSMVGVAIVAQFLLVVLLLSILNQYYAVARVLSIILGLSILVTVVNRDMATEAKIPWLIVILSMPLFGAAVYAMFSGNQLSRKQKRFLKKLNEEGLPFEQQQAAVTAQLKEQGGKYAGQAAYIHKATGQIAYGATDTVYFPSGERYWQDLLAELEQAQRYIFMEFFIIEEGVMWDSILRILRKKAHDGVEVRFIYDDIGTIGKVDNDYYLRLRHDGIKCIRFNPFRPVISAVHNNRDHRKIVVIDGTVGYVGGINLADEYINRIHPYGHWKDAAVKLVGDGVQGLTLMFLQSYDSQTDVLDCFADYLRLPAAALTPKSAAQGIVVPYGDGPRPMYQEYIAENIYLHLIWQAQQYLWITTPYLIIDGRLEGALCAAAKRGVDVRIVTPHIPDKRLIFNISRSHYKKLQRAGVKIFEYTPGFIHAKQFLCDDECAVVGSVNLDYRSLVHHFECGVWMWKTPCIPEIRFDFEKLFCLSGDMEGFHQNWLTVIFCRVVAAFSPLL